MKETINGKAFLEECYKQEHRKTLNELDRHTDIECIIKMLFKADYETIQECMMLLDQKGYTE